MSTFLCSTQECGACLVDWVPFFHFLCGTFYPVDFNQISKISSICFSLVSFSLFIKKIVIDFKHPSNPQHPLSPTKWCATIIVISFEDLNK